MFISVHGKSMPYEKEKIVDLEMLRKGCGLSVTELHRLAGTSRTTIYALERGQSVRRDAVVPLLQAMHKHPKCSTVRTEVKRKLKQLGVFAHSPEAAEDLIEAMEDVAADLIGFSTELAIGQTFAELESVKSAAEELQAAVETLLAKINSHSWR